MTTQQPVLHPAGCTCINCLKWMKENDPEKFKEIAPDAKKKIKPEYHKQLGL